MSHGSEPIGVYILMAIVSIGFGVGAAVGVWMHAPPVGGEWWPYVRVVASIVAASVGLKVGAVVGFFAGIAVILGGAFVR